MSGYTEQELLCMSFVNIEPKESAKVIAARIQKKIDAGEDRFETRHRRKDAGIYDVEIRVQCKHGFVSIIDCITGDNVGLTHTEMLIG